MRFPGCSRLAAARGLHVEVVALVDTKDLKPDIDAHVKAVGEIASRHPNALVEIANEPAHPTQSAAVHDAGELKRLAALIPRGVPVSLGSAEEDHGYAGAGYATYHFPRSGGSTPWGHVVRLADGAAFVTKWKKPVVSDEPIGAGPVSIPGRRDNDPDRFRAAALLTRMAGLGATFHYEQGLQARIPTGSNCAASTHGTRRGHCCRTTSRPVGDFHAAGETGAAVGAFDHGAASAVFERQRAGTAYVLVLNAPKPPTLTWNKGWRSSRSKQLGAAWLLTATRGGG